MGGPCRPHHHQRRRHHNPRNVPQAAYPRRPSSWRHPGGTVSETEESEFAQAAADEAAEYEEENKAEGAS